MKVQAKLTLVLVFAGLLSCIMVGASAYIFILEEFNKNVERGALINFKSDFISYVKHYGSLKDALKSEPLDIYAKRRHLSLPAKFFARGERPPANREHHPPFSHLVTDTNGNVLLGAGRYPIGTVLPIAEYKSFSPIEVDGAVVAYVSTIGTVNLSPEDKIYLTAVKVALINGTIFSVICTLLLGFVLGKGLSASLKRLIQAIHQLRESKDEVHFVPVTSNDEVGELAEAFNAMNEELAAAHKMLREQSIRDPLTQLYNRRYFNEQAKLQHEQSLRYGHPLSVMICDLDFFKRINDDYSHETGDVVLQQVAAILSSSTRKSDIVARYGGEEFVVIFPCTGRDDALIACEQIRKSIERYPWAEVQSGLEVTVSIGLCADTSCGSVDKMLSCADGALYVAKDSGRNTVRATAP